MTPHRSNAISKAISSPARAPVCDEAAAFPAGLIPDFRITTGFLIVALETTSKNFDPLVTDSK